MKTKNIPWVKFSVAIFALSGILTGCGGENSSSDGFLGNCPVVASWQTIGADTVLIGEAQALKDTLDIPLSWMVEDLQLIRLDSRDEALVKGERCFISGSYIFLQSFNQPIKQFDREGKYLRDIGQIGQGPNEYTSSIYYAQIDEPSNRIYFIPWANNSRILVYDLQGNACDPIPLAYTAPKMNFHIDVKKGIVTIGTLPFQGGKCPVMWIQDLKGNVIQEVDSKPFAVVPDFSNEISMKVTPEKTSFCIWHYPAKADTFYYYSAADNRMIPHYTMKYGASELPLHDYNEFGPYMLGGIIHGSMGGSTLPPLNYLIDQKTGRGAYIRIMNDFLDNAKIEYPFYKLSNGYFWENYDPGNLLDKIEARLASPAGLTDGQKKTLIQLSETLSVDDNNVIMIGRLKEDFSKPEGPVTFTIKQSAVTGISQRKAASSQQSTDIGSPMPPIPDITP